jgi:hypothetical protein
MLLLPDEPLRETQPMLLKEGRVVAEVGVPALDVEAAIRLQPINRRTWARHSQTPTHREWYRHYRLSVIGAVALSPSSRQISTPFQMHEDQVRTHEVVSFAKQLRRDHRHSLIENNQGSFPRTTLVTGANPHEK